MILTMGSRGQYVNYLQEALFYVGEASALSLDRDGEFGAKTRAAVMEFQKRFALAPTGVVDDSLIRAIVTEMLRMLVHGYFGYDRMV